MSEIVSKFLAGVAGIEALKPTYRQPGDGSDGTCDCIGLIIGAIRRMGLKWTGIHGCNWAARKEILDLQPLKTVSQLEKGMIVLKAHEPGNSSCKLPERYRKGKKYYTGDLRDYYHAGVVTSVSPLVITHMSGVGIQKSRKLSAWGFCGHLDLLIRAAGGKTASGLDSVSSDDFVSAMPAAGFPARVTAPNGGYVKMRQQPSQRCRLYDEVPVGTAVTVVAPGETWARIDYGRRKGWYMMARYLEIL